MKKSKTEMKNKIIDRLSFPTEYNTLNELKTSIILLFITCTVFFVISIITITFDLLLFSRTLLTGTLGYELILLYLLNDYTKKSIKKVIKEKKTRMRVGLLTQIIFSLITVITFFSLIYTMTRPAFIYENKLISLGLPLILIMLPTFFWHEMVKGFDKKLLKKLRLLIPLIIISCLMTNTAIGALDLNQTSLLTNNTGIIGQGLNFFTQVKDFFTSIQSFLNTNFGLNEQQTQIVTIILLLSIAFFVLKFLGFIVKWVIVILVAWIVIQMFVL